jgi:hypothetical protein
LKARLVIFVLCIIIGGALESKCERYFVGKDNIFFSVSQIQSINKNRDKSLSRYIRRCRNRKSITVNKFKSIPSRRGCYLLFFWKNRGRGEWGFVVAQLVKAGRWKLRMNGEKQWSEIKVGEEEMFKWFTAGRSVGVTLKALEKRSIDYLFSGDIDLK